MWEIEYTDQFGAWWNTLTEEQQVALTDRIDRLAEEGPALRRPYVGEIQSSAFNPRMKEIICDEGGSLRVLFIFDPRRTAILLLGGDKTGLWNRWYKTAVPVADDLYRAHLAELKAKGVI